jgi:SET domain-containing protein
MKQHSYLSPKCRVEKSAIHKRGVFARERISRGEIIALWGGVVYSLQETIQLAKKYPYFETHTVSICKDFYFGPITPSKAPLDDTEMMNHSCEPNAGVKGQLAVVARRGIRRGEEVCFDYDTTEISAVPFLCQCGTPSCRRRIDGSAWKDEYFRARNRGYFSWYIQEMIRKERAARRGLPIRVRILSGSTNLESLH